MGRIGSGFRVSGGCEMENGIVRTDEETGFESCESSDCYMCPGWINCNEDDEQPGYTDLKFYDLV